MLEVDADDRRLLVASRLPSRPTQSPKPRHCPTVFLSLLRLFPVLLPRLLVSGLMLVRVRMLPMLRELRTSWR